MPCDAEREAYNEALEAAAVAYEAYISCLAGEMQSAVAAGNQAQIKECWGELKKALGDLRKFL